MWRVVLIVAALVWAGGCTRASPADTAAEEDEDDRPLYRNGFGWSAVAAGACHTCGLRDDGTIEFWGQGDCQADQPLPSVVSHFDAPAGTGHIALASHGHGGCALDSAGMPTCWGIPTAPEGPLESLAIGDVFTCGLRAADRVAVCKDHYQSGPPRWFEGVDHPARKVAAGQHHACVIADDRSLTCRWDTWLFEPEVEGGAGWISDPPADERFVDVAVGSAGLACGVTVDGRIRCWGDRYSGPGEVSHDVPPGHDFTRVWFDRWSGDTACALRATGALVCWGRDNWGQARPPPDRFADVSIGSASYACGVTTAGELLCWGACLQGQCEVP